MWSSQYFGLGMWPPTFNALKGAPPAAITPASADFRRERYYEALYSRLLGLKTGGMVRTASRKVRTLEEMEPAQLPAMFMGVGKQKMKSDYNQGPLHSLWALLYLYVSNPNQAVSADIALNGLLDGVQASLKPDPGRGQQTLGDTVHAVWMGQGEDIETFAGPNGLLAAAIVPIEIVVAQ